MYFKLLENPSSVRMLFLLMKDFNYLFSLLKLYNCLRSSLGLYVIISMLFYFVDSIILNILNKITSMSLC